MDPDANLAELRQVAKDLLLDDGNNLLSTADLGRMLADLVQSLDEWICKGGALPKAWGHQASAVITCTYCTSCGYDHPSCRCPK